MVDTLRYIADGTMAERNHSMLRIQPMGEQPVAAVVAINLARVLTKLGAGNESEALYRLHFIHH